MPWVLDIRWRRQLRVDLRPGVEGEEWDELLAATIVTSIIAIPILLVTANIEVFVWPRLMELASSRY